MSKNDLQLLEEYQATGLTPEEVKQLKSDLEIEKLQKDIAYSNERMLRAELQRRKRELDAAIRDIKQVGGCETCRYEDPPNLCLLMDCFSCNDGPCHCRTCDEGSNWKWRGVKENT